MKRDAATARRRSAAYWFGRVSLISDDDEISAAAAAAAIATRVWNQFYEVTAFIVGGQPALADRVWRNDNALRDQVVYFTHSDDTTRSQVRRPATLYGATNKIMIHTFVLHTSRPTQVCSLRLGIYVNEKLRCWLRYMHTQNAPKKVIFSYVLASF